MNKLSKKRKGTNITKGSLTTTNGKEGLWPFQVFELDMDPDEEFEAVQKSCNERLNNLDEGNGVKRVKSSHREIEIVSTENTQMDSNMQIDEMTSSSQQTTSVTQPTTTNDQIRDMTSSGFQLITTNDQIESNTSSVINARGSSTGKQQTLSRDEVISDNEGRVNNTEVEEETQQKGTATEMVDKIQNEKKQQPLLYSAVVTGRRNLDKQQLEERRNKSRVLKNKVWRAKSKAIKDSFNSNEWSIDKIIEAFKSQESIVSFVKHKLETKTTSREIPPAIGTKLKYQDKAFFRCFTNRHETRPAHQNEFMHLLGRATDRYKQAYGAYVINKKNKDQIYDKLRKKLGIDFLTNTDFIILDGFEITQLIFFVAGFARLQNDLKFEELRKRINELKSDLLIQLPEHYDLIPKEIREALEYTLPIRDRRLTGEVVSGLRGIYKFDRLPESYIKDSRIPIPSYPSELREEFKNFFPVTDRADLKKVKDWKQDLRKFYIFSQLPESFFDLPPKKLELPLTYQELTPSLRRMFPFCPKDSEDFKEHVNKLRKVYAFKYLPNDYVINKKRLPENPRDLKINVKEGFPIKSRTEALNFIKSIPSYYRIPNPMPAKYIEVNYTQLEDLPEEWEEVKKVNLTVPITSTKELRIAVQALREHYFFHKIPEDWICIQNGDNKNEVDSEINGFPSDLEKLNKDLKQKEPESHWSFPITSQDKVPEALDYLREKYPSGSIPEWIFETEELPEPKWDIFDEQQITNEVLEDVEMDNITNHDEQ